ncbi:MAG TPA: hypothetical protein VLH08_01490 [Acidobacteriota bacterium]|nr:hypothetical protein [Acidobacteriota bacterium]
MSKDRKQTRWLVFTTVIILSAAIISRIQAHDSGEAMLRTLAATGPNSSLGDQAEVFNGFIGTWDCDYSFHTADGKISHQSGELMFGWVLDGLAVQDIWISYPKSAGKERSIGTSVRFFDTKAKIWKVVFVNPAFGSAINVEGGVVGDRIVLRGKDIDGAEIRWSFNDIKPGSFTWRGEKSRDNGKTWVLEEEHRMTRRDDAKKVGG